MEPWVTDKFYSHFPSYSQKSKEIAETKAKAQRLDYQNYLSRVASNTQNAKGRSNKRSTNVEKDIPSILKTPKVKKNQNEHEEEKENVAVKENVPTVNQQQQKQQQQVNEENGHAKNEQFLNKLEKMNLPEIFDADLIEARNKKLAEEKRKQNIQYQNELMMQIEQKKREMEQRKAREKEEEEKINRRMEEQLKSVRLQYELEEERPTARRENRRLPVNAKVTRTSLMKQSPKPPITVRSEVIEPMVYTYRSPQERKAQSENGKENAVTIKHNDKNIYKFFKNSARDPNPFSELRNHNISQFSDELSDLYIPPNTMSSYNTYPSNSPHKHHQTHNQLIAKNRNFCTQRCHFGHSQPENMEKELFCCDSCQPICLNCRKEICVHCKKPTGKDEYLLSVRSNQFPSNSTSYGKSPPRIWQPRSISESNSMAISPGVLRSIETDEESEADHQPFSFNIPESSVFHPSRSRVDRRVSVSIKNGELFVKPPGDVKLKMNERISNLAKNYGEFKSRKSNAPVQKKIESNQNPLPANTRRLMNFAKQLEKDEEDLKRITSNPNWHYGHGQKSSPKRNNDENALTLTQIGAFKKQLNLDKFNFDDEDDTQTHSYRY